MSLFEARNAKFAFILLLICTASARGEERSWVELMFWGVVGATGAVIAAPVVLPAMGFTSAGIAAGSIASGMMSTAALANGGGVAAGSVVAVLQSAGAAGIGIAAKAKIATVAAAATTAAYKTFNSGSKGGDNRGD